MICNIKNKNNNYYNFELNILVDNNIPSFINCYFLNRS